MLEQHVLICKHVQVLILPYRIPHARQVNAKILCYKSLILYCKSVQFISLKTTLLSAFTANYWLLLTSEL